MQIISVEELKASSTPAEKINLIDVREPLNTPIQPGRAIDPPRKDPNHADR
jgi:hypothetical protein